MTIRAKAIMIIMLVAVILTTASFFTSLSFTNRSLTEAIENDLSFAIEVADGLISSKMQLLRANAIMMAERLMRAGSTEEMAEIMAEHIAGCPDCISQSFFNRSGIITDCGDIPTSAEEIQADSKIIEMVYGGMTVISSPFYSSETGDFIIRVYTPMDMQTGSDGILSLTMSGMIFSDLVSGYKLWQTGNIYIINEEGTIIADVEKELVLGQRNFLNEYNADPDSASDEISGIARYLRQALLNEKGLDSYKYKGVERLCSYRLISGTLLGWRVAVVAPLTESPKASVRQGLVLAALFFLLIGLILSVIMSKFVSKPYYELEDLHKALSSQNERSRVLMDSAPFGMNLWNRDCVVFECNEESVKLFGLNSKKEYLERFNELSPEYQPDGRLSKEKTAAQMLEAFEKGYSACEWLHQKPDGTLIPAEAILVRVPYGDDYAVAGYTRDLREHNAMMLEIEQRDILLEAALKEAQKANSAKSDFLANMSHEMRTPLNAVIGLSELSLDGGMIEGEDYSNLEKIYNAGTTLLNLINDILDISKIEAGMLELVETCYDVPSLINDTITQNTIRIGDKPIEFKLEIGKEVFMHLHGDELRIKQIMNNLLTNAIKYTDEGIVELLLNNTREDDIVWFSITVSDTGRGIKPEDISKMFLDYTQMDKEYNRQIEGTGLGLPITRKLAEAMGGSVEVESEYGKGSIFTVIIKQRFVSETRINDEIINSLKNFRYSVNKRDRNTAIRLNIIRMPYARVLVVDDNATNLDVAKGLLSPYNMKVDCVESGQKAVDAIRAENKSYSAIFMDHMMPGMDGVEAARTIRELGTDYAKNIPIIAMTANTIIGNEEMFLSNGFQDFLPKPVDMSRLDELLRRWVRNKELEKALEDRSLSSLGQVAPGLYYEQDRRKAAERRSGIERRQLFEQLLGIDYERGIERFGGSEETFMNILSSYAQNTRPLLDVIEHVSEDSLDEYATIVHGIKGASRGILADMLGNSAENLENAAKTGDIAYINMHNQTFIEAVMKLIRDIDDLLNAKSTENPKPMKNVPDAMALQKLLDACKSYSMDEAESAMGEIETYQYYNDDGLVEWLRKNLKLTNFKQIIEKLSGLR